MPVISTIDQAFESFIQKITPAENTIDVARTRVENAVSLLRQGFEIGEVYETGSVYRGTAVPRISDADVIVEVKLPGNPDPTPQEMLDAVQAHMSPRHPGTQAREDGQAITLHYKTWPNVDIVPAKVSGRTTIPVIDPEFRIPDSHSGAWISTHPKKHDQIMRQLSEDHLRLIRMIKVWNHAHSKTMQSFHIETLVLIDAIKSISRNIYPPPPPVLLGQHGWSWAVSHFFYDMLYDKYGIVPLGDEPPAIGALLWRHVSHPVVEIGRVDNYMNAEEVLTRIFRAFVLSRDGFYCTHPFNGVQPDYQLATQKFKQLFGDQFPTTN